MANKKMPLILVFLLFLSSLALAQRDVGTFVGTISDTEGNPLPGVSITAKNLQTGLTQSTISNREGRYRIERLPPGVYTITATLEGFKTFIKEKIELSAGGELRVDFSLEIGKIEEQITVVGVSPLVETTRSQVSTVMTEKELLSYPQANRNFLNLMQYAPGTLPNAPTTMDTGFAVNGMRGESNNYMVDGLDNNDMTDNSFNIATLPPESIQEFRLISNNFSAEYGRNLGGILNIVMKSGTNELHGSGWLFFRGDSPLFRSADWLTHERPPYERYQYGGTLGGPIKKDKTFFFASFEGIKQRIDQVSPSFFFTPQAIAKAKGSAKAFFDKYKSAYPVPTYDFIDADGDKVPDYGRAAFQYADKYKAYTGGIKIDHIFSEKDRVAFRWLYNYNKTEDGFPYYWVPGKALELPNSYHVGGLSWLHLFSPTMYNELRLGLHRDHWEWLNQDTEMACFGFWDEPRGMGDPGYPMTQINTTYQLVDVLNFQKGNHSIKTGGELRYWRVFSSFDALVLGYYVYASGMDWINNQSCAYLIFGANPPDPDPKNPYVPGDPKSPWKTGFGLTDRKWKGFELALFVQDDWRVSERLTLSLGLRWEFNSVPEEISGVGINQPAFGTKQGYDSKQVIEGQYNEEGIRYLIFDGRELLGKGLWNPYYKAFAPKVSFAYDLTGDGKTSLRAGAGISYDRQMNRSYENDRFNYPDFCFATFFGDVFGGPPIIATTPGTVPMAAVTGVRTSLRWMLPDLKPQMAYNWLFGLQREVTPNFSIEIDYAGSAGRNIGNMHRPNRYTGDGLDGRFDGINPYCAITDMNTRENINKSNYHSLQVILRKRFANGWSWYSAYTYGVAKDYSSLYQSGIAVSHERLDMEYGYTDYDARHRVVGGLVYDLPFFKGSSNWFLKNVVAGWQIAASFHATSGRHFDVVGYARATDYNLDGNRIDRPLWLGEDYKDAIKWSAGTPYLDKSLFGKPNPPKAAHDLTYYNQNFLPRNAFTWFPTHNIDISLQKYFTVPVGGREVNIQLIGEVFNLLKSQFWALPVTNYALGTFGTVARMTGDRTAQVSIRIMF